MSRSAAGVPSDTCSRDARDMLESVRLRRLRASFPPSSHVRLLRSRWLRRVCSGDRLAGLGRGCSAVGGLR